MTTMADAGAVRTAVDPPKRDRPVVYLALSRPRFRPGFAPSGPGPLLLMARARRGNAIGEHAKPHVAEIIGGPGDQY